MGLKRKILQTVTRNQSRYPTDLVWENAQDLEHVAYIHGRTNRAFELLFWEREKDSPFTYDVMIYRAKRRFHCFWLQSFGFRKILSPYNLWQLEILPALGIRSALNSRLVSQSDPEFPTLMIDEVILEVPWPMALFSRSVEKAIERHAAIQCQEDEAFRERRFELNRRGIHFPYSIFHQSEWERLTQNFGSVPVRSGTPGWVPLSQGAETIG